MKKVLSIILLLNCFYVAFALDKIYIADIIGYDSIHIIKYVSCNIRICRIFTKRHFIIPPFHNYNI